MSAGPHAVSFENRELELLRAEPTYVRCPSCQRPVDISRQVFDTAETVATQVLDAIDRNVPLPVIRRGLCMFLADLPTHSAPTEGVPPLLRISFIEPPRNPS